MCVLSRFSLCPTIASHWICPMDSGSIQSVHWILQARILEWVAMPSSRGSSQPRDQNCVSCIAGRFFTTEPLGQPILLTEVGLIDQVFFFLFSVLSVYCYQPVSLHPRAHVLSHVTHGLQPARLLCPWTFTGKNTGVGCHFLLQLTGFSNKCSRRSSLAANEKEILFIKLVNRINGKKP